MRNVTISVIQLENKLFDKNANLLKADGLIRQAAAKGAKMICLPELFVTGYNLNAFGDRIYELGEGLTGPTITHMRALAKELGVYIIAPIAMLMRTTRPLENNAVVIDDEGEVIGTYSKNHLFGDEPKYFTANGEYPVFDTKYGKIGIMICCDNNFPEPARILALGGAELIFMPAAWRVQEADLWKLLISSHARTMCSSPQPMSSAVWTICSFSDTARSSIPEAEFCANPRRRETMCSLRPSISIPCTSIAPACPASRIATPKPTIRSSNR